MFDLSTNDMVGAIKEMKPEELEGEKLDAAVQMFEELATEIPIEYQEIKKNKIPILEEPKILKGHLEKVELRDEVGTLLKNTGGDITFDDEFTQQIFDETGKKIARRPEEWNEGQFQLALELFLRNEVEKVEKTPPFRAPGNNEILNSPQLKKLKKRCDKWLAAIEEYKKIHDLK